MDSQQKTLAADVQLLTYGPECVEELETFLTEHGHTDWPLFVYDKNGKNSRCVKILPGPAPDMICALAVIETQEQDLLRWIFADPKSKAYLSGFTYVDQIQEPGVYAWDYDRLKRIE